MSERKKNESEQNTKQPTKRSVQIKYDIITPDERPPQPKDLDEIE